MGGITLQPRDGMLFLITSRRLACLLQNKYMNLPDVTEEEIVDKSKADTLAKIVTLLQASWLLLNLVGRARLGLAISTLELSTGAIVICTFGTFVCWLRKPSDVRKGDAAAQPYRHTPLDFVAKEFFTCGYDVLGFFNLRCDRLERPLRCFPNDRVPDISTLEKFLLFCTTTIYSGLHLLGWRFSFPSHTESVLWRMSSLTITGVTVLFWLFETAAARYRFGRWEKYLIMLHLKKPIVSAPAEMLGENDANDTARGHKREVVVRQNSLERRDFF